MPTPVFTKDPAAVLDYSIDWSEWLEAEESIAVSTWTIEDGDGELTEGGTDLGSTETEVMTKCWLSGGTAGQQYTVTNTIETDSFPARKDSRSFVVNVRER